MSFAIRQFFIKSLKNRLLLWLILPLLLASFIALYDTRNYANKTANEIYDQTLAGSTVAIAERVVVGDNGELDVDIPYIALELLTSAAYDRIFYQVNGVGGEFITGYKKLKLSGKSVNKIAYSHNQDILFYDGIFRGEKIRLAKYSGVAIGREGSHNFEVLLAETTQARDILAQDILFSTGWRLGLLLLTALIFVWIGIVIGLRPLTHLQQAIGRRNPKDLHPITHVVPLEVEALISGINHFMARLGNSLSALRSFTGNAEHQIKTPLSVAKTNIYLAQQTDDSEEKYRLLTIANQAINRCERILSQLILLSKVENEAAEKSKNSFNLIDQVKLNIAREYPAAAQAGIDLGFENQLNNQHAAIIGNETLFNEMLHNLIQNIFIHSDGCTQATLYLSEDRINYYLRIEDNGIGIEPELYDKMLQRFGQSDAAKDKGSGLGLSIAKEIMALYNGEVKLSAAQQLTSQLNGGLSVELKFEKPPIYSS